MVQSVADSQVAHVIERINQPGGGVFALVGERGSGKTTLLRRIALEAPCFKLPSLALQHELTAYDAAYLEVALRLGLPMATKDKALKRAMANAGVTLVQSHDESGEQSRGRSSLNSAGRLRTFRDRFRVSYRIKP
jgi:hypothetical protein